MRHEDVGSLLRRMRLGSGMTLNRLAKACGLSPSFLSQFERGHTHASIGSLRLITDALGMDIDDVFDNVSGFRAVVRHDDRPELPSGSAVKTIVSSRALARFEVLEVTFDVGGSTGRELYAHGHHEEILIVSDGVVGVELGGERQLLDPGDSISFHSSTPHRVTNASETKARLLWIVSPPAYSNGLFAGKSVPR